MYLDLEPGCVRIADEVETEAPLPMVCKAEVGFTSNIEGVLEALKVPLDVTHTVNPDEVFANLEVWRPAILKEIKGIEVAIEPLQPGSEARAEWLNKPGIQR